MRYLLYVFVLVLMLVAVIFAVSNLHDIEVHFEPLPIAITGPVYAWILVTFVVGFFSGWFAAWLRGLGARHRDRVLARRAEQLEKETAELRQRLDTAEAPPSSGTMAVVPSDRRMPAASR